jgi:DNA polymerase III sliding clamp (beta) subunit (PCNA family)
VRAAFTGEEPVISFNPNYLLDGLAAAAICGSAARHPAGTADAAEAEPGRVRLEFTSPAKPALITWVGYEGGQVTEAADTAADLAEATAAGALDADAPEADAGDDGTPAFRYLVVPLRSPAASGSTRA